MRRFASKLLLVFGLLLIPWSFALAGPILDFNMNASHPAGAQISFAGGTNPLIGVSIGVDTVLGLATPDNSGSELDITNGVLAFTTGNFSGSTATSWMFAGGGTITLTGTISSIGINDPAQLIHGTFTSASVIPGVGTDFKVAITSFIDDKNETLAGYYGLDGMPGWVGNFNLSFTATAIPPGSFTSASVLSGDIYNTPVPEPGTLILVGIGLLGTVGFARFYRR